MKKQDLRIMFSETIFFLWKNVMYLPIKFLINRFDCKFIVWVYEGREVFLFICIYFKINKDHQTAISNCRF